MTSRAAMEGASKITRAPDMEQPTMCNARSQHVAVCRLRNRSGQRRRLSGDARSVRS